LDANQSLAVRVVIHSILEISSSSSEKVVFSALEGPSMAIETHILLATKY
jgi:hypothetical protein